MHTPGLQVVYPATAYDAKGLLKWAIRDKNPVIFLEHKLLYRRNKESCRTGVYRSPGAGLGAARGARIDYSHLCGHGAHVAPSRETGGAEGMEAEVLDLRTLLPLDRQTLAESLSRPTGCWWCTRTRAPEASPGRLPH